MLEVERSSLADRPIDRLPEWIAPFGREGSQESLEVCRGAAAEQPAGSVRPMECPVDQVERPQPNLRVVEAVPEVFLAQDKVNNGFMGSDHAICRPQLPPLLRYLRWTAVYQ
ncbi:hypothetical protein DB459_25775 [Bradyrhizobium sp. WD16]|nr:hypothetical protein DB459_25775 [Bradyrhizobium sp. WD16]